MILYSIYKLIKLLIFKLPTFVHVVWDFISPPTEEFFDVEEPNLVAEANGAINMVYAAFITMLPFKIRKILETYQAYTRIKILEDMSWIYQIADLILHIPAFVCHKTSELLSTLPNECAQNLSTILARASQQFEGLLDMFPELMSVRILDEMTTFIGRIQGDRKLLANKQFMSEADNVLQRATRFINNHRANGHNESVVFRTVFTELTNLYRSGLFLIKPSHPEPVAVLLYSRPGQGKTYFVSALRECLTRGGANTIYDYVPTDSKSDFHDQYMNQNIWIHEDIGQRNVSDWGQYIIHIGSNPSRMDGAALDKKSTIFFESQIILGTTNIPIHNKVLKREPNCGWTDERAIYRRWTVILFDRTKKFNVSRVYDHDRDIWHNGPTFNVGDVSQFAMQLYNMRLDNVQKHETILQQSSNLSFDLNFANIKPDMDELPVDEPTDEEVTVAKRNARSRAIRLAAEGRKKEIVVAIEHQDTVEEVQHYQPRFQVVEGDFDAKKLGIDQWQHMFDMSEQSQSKLLAGGYLINGGTQVVGHGRIVITRDITTWKKWLQATFEQAIDEAGKKFASSLDFIRSLSDTLTVFVDGKVWAIAGFITGLSIFGVLVYNWYKTNHNKAEHFESFVSYGRVKKRLTAVDVFAEVRTTLQTQDPPNETIRSVQRNVLSCEYTYRSVTTYSYALALDAHRIMLPAHSLLGADEKPTEIFVRARDMEEREIISSFFVPTEWNVILDYVILTYKNAHATVFRTMESALTKKPTSIDLFLVLTEGVVPIGHMDHNKFISGTYWYKSRPYDASAMLTHTYDGKAMDAAGLCGAPVVTKDGFLVGWHIASDSKGTGYVRIWPLEIKKHVYEAKTPPPQVELASSNHKGVLITTDKTYHHVNLKSAIKPSAMLVPMLQHASLVDNTGNLPRQPCELGGHIQLETGEVVRTYDNSRTKNFTVVEKPVNMEALNFATEYVRDLLTTYVGAPVAPLTEEEMVNGVSEDLVYMNKLNKDASAGVPWGKTIAAMLVDGKIAPEVKDLMLKIEGLASQKKKDPELVKFKDCDKDEMRDAEKINKPRCFSAGPLHYTLLLRKWFGRIGSTLMRTRHQHGIMIGINATSREWQTLWHGLSRFCRHFDGDYKKWDGAMRREFQERLNSVLSTFTQNPTLSETLLTYLCETTHVGMDLTYITTHSVPSGHGLTALYNSLMNKMLLAYAWYILYGQFLKMSIQSLIAEMNNTLYAPVYGDDLVAAVAERIATAFNAVKYSIVMDDLGIGFTAANKKAHVKPFGLLRDVTFLKRHFVAHRTLQSIVGPLDINVLKATCGYVHDVGRDREITDQKMSMIQRELFLHGDVTYYEVWGALLRCYEEAFGAPYTGVLTDTAIVEIYNRGELRSDLFADLVAESGKLPSHRKNRQKLRWQMKK